MDKNMINIDELVRLRLSGGEEHERPGSWANMRELLDQKMPTNKPVAAYNWRRMLGVMTGLALLSALSIGGYQVMSTKFADKNAPKASVINKATTPANRTAPSGSIAANKPGADNAAGKTELSNHASNALNRIGHNKSTGKAKATGPSSSIAANIPAQTVNNQSNKNNRNNKNGRSEIAANQAETKINQQINNSVDDRKDLVAVTTNRPDLANATPQSVVAGHQAIKETTSANVLALGSKPAIPADNNSAKSSTNATAKGEINNIGNESAREIQPSSNVKAPLQDNTATAKIKTPAPLKPTLPKDSFRAMTVVQRSVVNPLAKTRTLITDTVSIERIALERNVLTTADASHAQQSATAKADESNAQVNPASSISLAAAKADAGIKEDMVSLSNLKVKSRKTSKWDAQAFQDKMRDVKFNLAQIKFYPGVSAGYSYMSTRNISGVQFGLFGLVTFGDNWNAMAEIKYAHRFNSGSVLQDDYSIVKPSGSTFLQSKVQHFFKFSTLQSIEMPVALRYAAGRLNLFGGVNMNYNFAVNAEEIKLEPDESQYAPVTEPDWANTKPTMSYRDFHSRFGLGYLLGAGYELSPAIQLDLRATQNIWDNAAGAGAQRVSRELYRAPTFQVSLFYRFSQKNQIPKAK